MVDTALAQLKKKYPDSKYLTAQAPAIKAITHKVATSIWVPDPVLSLKDNSTLIWPHLDINLKVSLYLHSPVTVGHVAVDFRPLLSDQ